MFKKFLLLVFCLPAFAFANAYAVLNYTTGQYEHEYNSGVTYSIASITKLFTAYAIVKSGVDMSEKVKVQGKSTGRFVKGSMVPRMDLFKSMLISSDNLAAESLAYAHPGGMTDFILDTNKHIRDLSLTNTEIVEPTGLYAGNVSTVNDLSKFLFHIKDYDMIRIVAGEKEDHLKYNRGTKTITVNIRNTNPAMWVYDNIVMSKTGFTNAAGRCVAMIVQKNSDFFAVIVLGQSSVKKRSIVVNDLMGRL